MVRSIVLTACCLLLLAGAPAQASGPALAQPARRAALAWLGLVDGGQYARSWDQAARFFQGAVSRDTWGRTLRGVREPLGALRWRHLISAQQRSHLPGAPDGQYELLVFNTSFTRKKTAQERLTLVKEPRRGWRVVGYFIK